MTRIIPGVEIQVIKEIVPQQLNPSGIVAMIGTVEKGEVLSPTHVSSYREFADKFGSSEQIFNYQRCKTGISERCVRDCCDRYQRQGRRQGKSNLKRSEE